MARRKAKAGRNIATYEQEGLAGQVQMVYMDPPYGIDYGSNFQPFVNRRAVTDGRDADLTAEHRRAAVKIVDARGVESLRVVELA